MLNLARRHLEGWQWGQGFGMLLEEEGVGGRGGDRTKEQSATIALCAQKVGVPERTAKWRLAEARAFDTLTAKEQEAVRRTRHVRCGSQVLVLFRHDRGAFVVLHGVLFGFGRCRGPLDACFISDALAVS